MDNSLNSNNMNNSNTNFMDPFPELSQIESKIFNLGDEKNNMNSICKINNQNSSNNNNFINVNFSFIKK